MKFKEIICPICGKFYFSKPQDELDEEEYNNGEVHCKVCGWIYDEKQIKNPELKTGFNVLSMSEYVDSYQSKIKLDPKYEYWKSVEPKKAPHICPVCNKHKFRDLLSFDICPVCGWQDDGYEKYPDEIGASNLSYNDFIKKYKDSNN